MTSGRLKRTTAVLRLGIDQGLHIGAQIHVWHQGTEIDDLALGESRPGVAMLGDTLMLWLSAAKPVGAVAAGQLFEQGRLHFDDPVIRFIPEFGHGGKAPISLRHLLTHTGGFRNAEGCDASKDWKGIIDCICRSSLEPGWVPGQMAGYHVSASWFILAEIIQRVDGRSYDRYVRETIFEPLAMTDSWIGMPARQVREYGNRLGVMQVTGKSGSEPFQIDRTKEDFALCRPASRGRGPIRELGRFYRMLLSGGSLDGTRILKPATVSLLTRRHRVDMFDRTFQHKLDWGLGFILNSNQYGPDTVPYGFGKYSSKDTFGHGGSQSSCAFADPVHRLVVAWVCNGRPGERRHQKRAREINEAIYEDLGLTDGGKFSL